MGGRPAVVLFAILVAHAMLETARDALFLTRLDVRGLALAYLIMAATAVTAIVLVRRFLRVRDPRRLVVIFIALATLGTAILAGTIAVSRAAVFVLYVWTGVVATLVVPSFWTALDRTLVIAEAKRTFGTIGAGGVLGAMVGSALAGAIGHVYSGTVLVAAAAVMFAFATVLTIVLLPRTAVAEPPTRRVRTRRRSRSAVSYLRFVIALTITGTIALTLGDLAFKSLIARRVAPADLATWFGAIYAVLNAVGLVVQVVVTPRLLARWGIGVALAVLPVIVLASALGFALTGALIAVVALKLGDGGLRHSLHRVSTEILYLPVPSRVRDGGKLVADALGQRGGQAIAAVVGGCVVLFGGGPQALAMLAAAFAAAWLVAVEVTRRGYIAQLQDSLQAGEIQRDVVLPALDVASIQLLERSIAGEDEIAARAALDLLARRGTIPALALRDPREGVVRHALSVLHGALPRELAEVLVELIHHPSPEVRAAAVAAAGARDKRLLRAALEDEAPAVRAVALVHLWRDASMAAQIESMVNGTTADRVALAEAIGYAPCEHFRGLLHQLLDRGEPAVARSVLHVLARAPRLADLERLLPLLAERDLRGDVRRVFLDAGSASLDVLITALDSPATALAVRRHLPRTIMRFTSPRAVAALALRLPHESDAQTERKLLRALGRMRAELPDVPLDLTPVREYLRRSVREAARYKELVALSMTLQASTLITELLADRYRAALEHTFRALGIVAPRAGWRSVHHALASGDPARLPAARELVEALAPPDVRGALVEVIGGAPVSAPAPLTREAIIAALLEDRSETVRCAALQLVRGQRPVEHAPVTPRRSAIGAP